MQAADRCWGPVVEDVMDGVVPDDTLMSMAVGTTVADDMFWADERCCLVDGREGAKGRADEQLDDIERAAVSEVRWDSERAKSLEFLGFLEGEQLKDKPSGTVWETEFKTDNDFEFFGSVPKLDFGWFAFVA